MIIKISNPLNHQTLTFLGHYEWLEKYKNSCKNYQTIAIEDNTYQLLRDNLTGFFALPYNNTNSNRGIDQDGTLYLNNYYDDRLITFSFRNIYSANLTYQNSTLYQNDVLLDMEVVIDDRHFFTKGTINGNVEEGVVDMSCEPFFRTGELRYQTLNIPFEFDEYLLPFTLPQTLVNGFKSSGNDTLDFDIEFTVEPIITVKGNVLNFSITDVNTNSTITINGRYNNIVINSYTGDIYLNGIENNNRHTGILPMLNGGKQTLIFNWEDMLEDLEIIVEYDKLVGSVL